MPTRGPIRSTSLIDNGTTVSTTENLQVGGATAATLRVIAAAGSGIPAITSAAYIVHAGGSFGALISRAANDTGPARLTLYKTRATDAAVRGAAINGDVVGTIATIVTDGTTDIVTNTISSQVIGTVSTGIIPTNLAFSTTSTGGVNATALTLNPDQSATFSNTVNIPTLSNTATLTSSGIVNLGGFSRVTGSNFTTTGQALTNITGLTFATVANATYHFRVLMTTTSSSVAGNQYGIQHSGAGASVEAQASGVLLAGGAQSVRINALNTATVAFDTAAADGGMCIEGILVVGANAGNLTPQILKVTSGTATVYINSFMEVKRIA